MKSHAIGIEICPIATLIGRLFRRCLCADGAKERVFYRFDKNAAGTHTQCDEPLSAGHKVLWELVDCTSRNERNEHPFCKTSLKACNFHLKCCK